MATAPVHAAPSANRRNKRGSPPFVTAGAAVALVLGASVLYAAFDSGAIELPGEARLQGALAALALATLGAFLFAPGMRARASVAGWAGLAALALFAVWT